ncbi:MAG: hypothetical protein ABI598_06735 [Chloroflexota bacterium]
MSGSPPPPARRPVLERLGMAVIALFLAFVFGVMAVASWVGGEPFLAAMAATGAFMAIWAGARTVLRG